MLLYRIDTNNVVMQKKGRAQYSLISTRYITLHLFPDIIFSFINILRPTLSKKESIVLIVDYWSNPEESIVLIVDYWSNPEESIVLIVDYWSNPEESIVLIVDYWSNPEESFILLENCWFYSNEYFVFAGRLLTWLKVVVCVDERLSTLNVLRFLL